MCARAHACGVEVQAGAACQLAANTGVHDWLIMFYTHTPTRVHSVFWSPREL